MQRYDRSKPQKKRHEDADNAEDGKCELNLFHLSFTLRYGTNGFTVGGWLQHGSPLGVAADLAGLRGQLVALAQNAATNALLVI